MSFWLRRSVFVTGGSGLVGSTLVRRLTEAGANVVCLMRDWVPESELITSGTISKCTVVRGDICDRDMLERVLGEHEIQTVIHLAAQTIVGIANRNPISTFEANIMGTWNVLEACRRSPRVSEVVLASSDKAYGDQTVLPYTEETALEGRHPYDVSKSCSDLIGRTYFESYGMNVGITRCGNFYGAGDLNWNRIVPGTIRSIYDGVRPVIRSDGKFVRDYFYVEDGAHAYMTLAEALGTRTDLAGEAFNFSNEIQADVLDIVARVTKLMGSGLEPIIANEASNEIRHQYLSAEKARRVLNWKPLYSLEEGLVETIAWYTKFFEQHKAEALKPS